MYSESNDCLFYAHQNLVAQVKLRKIPHQIWRTIGLKMVGRSDQLLSRSLKKNEVEATTSAASRTSCMNAALPSGPREVVPKPAHREAIWFRLGAALVIPFA